MKKHFTPKTAKQSQGLSILTSPWFVIGLVVVCFGILTPKIFMPLFMQTFGLNNHESRAVERNMDPRMRPPNGGAVPPLSEPRSNPQFGRPGPGAFTPPPAAPAGKSSLLTMLLPVYAIGIGIYMCYTLSKVFNKDTPKEENDSDYEDIEKRNLKFKENMCALDQVWDPETNEFKSCEMLKRQTLMSRSRSEESEDELNEYARYNSVDPEYLAYLKHTRKQKREKKALMTKTAANIEGGGEIALTPGVGLTSITNTNVLMNDTLERMKHSLNKINSQLVEVEKKGHPMEDPELDTIRLQLTQTELQMQKIMSIVNSVSASLDVDNEEEESDRDDFNNQFRYQQDLYNDLENKSKHLLRNRKNQEKKQANRMQKMDDEFSAFSSNMSSMDSPDQASSPEEEILVVNKKRAVKKTTVGDEMVNTKKQANTKKQDQLTSVPQPEKPVNLKNQQKNLKKKLRKKAKAKNES